MTISKDINNKLDELYQAISPNDLDWLEEV